MNQLSGLSRALLLLASLTCLASSAHAWAWGVTNHVWMTGGDVVSSPAITTNGTLVVGSRDGNVYEFRTDGTTNHVWHTGGAVVSSPAINTNGSIFAGSLDGRLYEFLPNGNTGTIWQTGDEIQSSPAIGFDGTIYVGSYDGCLYAFNPDGTTNHVWSTGYRIHSSPVIKWDGTIYVGSWDQNLYAFNPDGTTNHVWTTGHIVEGSPAISTDGTLYVGSYDGRLYALNPNGTTNRVWSFGDALMCSPAIGTDGRIYMGAGHSLFALNTDGTTARVWQAGGNMYGSPAIGSDGTIFIGSRDSRFYAFNQNGTTNFIWNTGDFVDSSPTIGLDGTLYVGSCDNAFYAFSGTVAIARTIFPKFRHDLRNTGLVFDPPASIWASDGTYTNQIAVWWAGAIGASGYEVWRNITNDTSSATKIADASTTNYSDITASAGILYYYWVKATNSLGLSRFSDSDTGWQAMIPPTGVVASDGSFTNLVRVQWDAASGAQGYEVWRNTANNTNTAARIGLAASTNYDDSAAIAGTTYYYWVKATNFLEVTGFSAPDTGWRAMSPPAGVIASDGTFTNLVRVQWSAETGAQGYQVWRNTLNDTNTAASIGLAASTNYDDLTATAGTVYYYWVKATNTLEITGFSAPDTGWRAMSPPSGLVASDGTFTNQVVLRWTAETGAQGYQVWRNTSNNTNTAASIGLAASTNYDDLTATAGTVYYYWVKATNLLEVTGFSAPDTGWRAMSPPAGVLASDGAYTNMVRVQWDAETGATGYEVWRNTVNNTNTATRIGPAEGTNYDDSAAIAGTVYYYWVKATNTLEVTGFSDSDTGWRAMAPPTGLTASDGTYTNMIRLAWSAAVGSQGYEVWRNTVNDTNSAAQIGSAPGTGYDDATILPGTVYYYWVRGTNGLQTTWFSAPDSGWRAIRPPSGVVASDGSFTNLIRVQWTAEAGATGYEVWRAPSSGPGAATLIAGGPGTSCDDASAAPGILYYYWIKATNSLQITGFSTPDTGWRAMSPPAGVSASDGTYSSMVQVSWLSEAGATGYEIWRNTSGDTNTATLIGASGSTSFNDTSSVAGTIYYYWVRATNSYEARGFGGPDIGWRGLLAPSGLAASDGVYTNMVRLTWAGSQGATGYEVWRSITDDIGSASRLASVAGALLYDDQSAAAGVMYHYWVRGTNALNTSAFSASDTGWRAVGVPAVMTATKGTVNSRVQIDWSSSVGAESYELWRGPSDNFGAASLLASGLTGNSYLDADVRANTVYYYWIRGVNGGVMSGFAGPDYGFSRVRVFNDFDGDGATDVTLYNSQTGEWYIRAKTGATLCWGQQFGGAGFMPLSGDYNGDGVSEMAVFEESTGRWYIRKLDGTILLWSELWGAPGMTPLTGDYDGDGVADLAAYDRANGLWYIRTMAGQTLLWAEAWGGSSLAPVPGDYDGDNAMDLAMYFDGWGIWFIRATDGQTIAWGDGWGGAGMLAIPGDYDRDGVSDLAVYDDVRGVWYVKSMTGRILLWQEPWGGEGYTAVSGDYNGDGWSDLALYHEQTGTWYVKSPSGETIYWGEAWGGPGLVPVKEAP